MPNLKTQPSEKWLSFNHLDYKDYFPTNRTEAQYLEDLLTRKGDGFVTRAKALVRIADTADRLKEAKAYLSTLCKDRRSVRYSDISPREGYAAFLKACTVEELKNAATVNSVSYTAFMSSDTADRSELIEVILEERFPVEVGVS